MNSQDNNGYLPTTYLLFTVSRDKKKSCGTFSHAMQEQNKLGGTLWFYFSGEAKLLVRTTLAPDPFKNIRMPIPNLISTSVNFRSERRTNVLREYCVSTWVDTFTH
jgi:hypothetical protein